MGWPFEWEIVVTLLHTLCRSEKRRDRLRARRNRMKS